MSRIPKPINFNWDSDNINKNWAKHQIRFQECEQMFFNRPLKIYSDLKHSQAEKRFVAYGITDNRKKLTIIFTIRKQQIRIISARSMSRKERRLYDQKN